jgi:hypothetical protein
MGNSAADQSFTHQLPRPFDECTTATRAKAADENPPQARVAGALAFLGSDAASYINGTRDHYWPP